MRTAWPDGWERAYGLDPTSEADALSDVDGDRLSAVREYALLSDPTKRFSDPNRFSQSIEASLTTDVNPDTGEPTYSAIVRGDRSTGKVRPIDDTFTVTLPEGAEWDRASLPEGCAPVEGAATALRCRLPVTQRHTSSFASTADFEVGPLGIRSGSASTLSVAAAYAPLASRLSPETASFRTVEQSTAPRVPDFAVSAPARAFGSDEETRTLVATVVQPVPAAPADRPHRDRTCPSGSSCGARNSSPTATSR